MKALTKHMFDKATCRAEWDAFDKLLSSKTTLDEAKDVLPFFKSRHDLSMLIADYFPNIKAPDVFAHEFPFYGDFRADLVVGDSATHNYLLVEFEDGRPDSVFSPGKSGAIPKWALRYECAFSQLLDWLWKLEDMRSTHDFINTFGDRQAKFHGLIVIGKDMSLAKREASRLKWRTDRVVVDSSTISCVSFNELHADLDYSLKTYFGV